MPLVEVKVCKDELTPDQTHALILKITDTVTAVTSEKLRGVTWVIVSEVPSGNWGVGGTGLPSTLVSGKNCGGDADIRQVLM